MNFTKFSENFPINSLEISHFYRNSVIIQHFPCPDHKIATSLRKIMKILEKPNFDMQNPIIYSDFKK